MEVSISQSSLGRFTPVRLPRKVTARDRFNLAIEFGRFTRRLRNPRLAQLPVSISQSSLGGSRLCLPILPNRTLRVSISQSSLGGSRVHAVRPLESSSSWFQSRNRVWAVHAGRTWLPSAGSGQVSISQSSLGGSRWGSRRNCAEVKIIVSISQSSLGGSRGCDQRGRFEIQPLGFNLAIEFGRFTHCADTGAIIFRVSISQSSLGGSRRHIAQSRHIQRSFNLAIEFGRFTPEGITAMTPTGASCVSISQSSLGGSRPAMADGQRGDTSFNLAIEFGRFTPSRGAAPRTFSVVSISQSSLGGSRQDKSARPGDTNFRFQSRNRVWAVHANQGRRPLGSSTRFQSRNRVWAVHAWRWLKPCCNAQGFNLAIEFGRFTPGRACPSRPVTRVSISQSSLGGSRCERLSTPRPSSSCFNLAIEFGRFTPRPSPPRRRPSRCFNLAIEFGRFTPPWIAAQIGRRFQSRNRVWAVHAGMSGVAGGESDGFQSRNRVWAVHATSPMGEISAPTTGFNLAIEFGRFTLRCAAMVFAVQDGFQSRNRVWAVHAIVAASPSLCRPRVSISQSSLGGSRFMHDPYLCRCFRVSISQSSLGGSRRGLSSRF